MTRDEFDLLAVRDEPSVIDRMTPPTLDEWTVAIETLKTKESRCVYFERNGVPAVQYEISSSGQGGIWTYNDPGNAMNYVQSYGINQQNSGQYQSQAPTERTGATDVATPHGETMTRERLRKTTTTRIRKSKKSMRAFAEDIGLSSAAHLCRFLKHGSRPPAKVITALGYRSVDSESYELRK